MATPGEPPRGPQYPGGLLGMPSDPLGLSGAAAAGRSSGPGMDVDPAHGIQLPELEADSLLAKLTSSATVGTATRWGFKEVCFDPSDGTTKDKEGVLPVDAAADGALDPAGVAAAGAIALLRRDAFRNWVVVSAGGAGTGASGPRAVAQLTSTNGVAYSWQEKVQTAPGVWGNGARSGSLNAYPTNYAASSARGWPALVGSWVELWPSAIAGTYEFDHHQFADATHPGEVSLDAQVLGDGDKEFRQNVSVGKGVTFVTTIVGGGDYPASSNLHGLQVSDAKSYGPNAVFYQTSGGPGVAVFSGPEPFYLSNYAQPLPGVGSAILSGGASLTEGDSFQFAWGSGVVATPVAGLPFGTLFQPSRGSVFNERLGAAVVDGVIAYTGSLSIPAGTGVLILTFRNGRLVHAYSQGNTGVSDSRGIL